MKYFRVSDNKIKVRLSPADMAHYGLSKKDGEEMGSRAQKIFWQILDDCKPLTHFDVGCGRVLLQFTVGENGTGELTATKLTAEKPKRGAYGTFLRFSDEAQLGQALSALKIKPPRTLVRYAGRLYCPLAGVARQDALALTEYGGCEVPENEAVFVTEHGKLTPFFLSERENREEAKAQPRDKRKG